MTRAICYSNPVTVKPMVKSRKALYSNNDLDDRLTNRKHGGHIIREILDKTHPLCLFTAYLIA